MVGFAGDFFGPLNELSIICTASSPLEAKNLFYKAFIQVFTTIPSHFKKNSNVLDVEHE
jgi:hypothetical protein